MRLQSGLVVMAMLCCATMGGNRLLAEEKSERTLHLPFWDIEDVRDTVGRLDFHAEPLQKEGLAEGYPAMLYGCEVPREDGTAWAYGWKLSHWQDRASRTVEVVRALTRDGKTFTNEETVLSLVNKDWQGFVNLVRRPTDGRLFLFSWSAGILQVYGSEDGKQWTQLTDKAYVDHDAMNIIWYPPLGEFVNFQNTLEKYPKRYPDNIGEYRRVLSFRKSKDGVTWDWFSPPFLNGKKYWTPDKNDPIDLEFYRSVVFPTQGRYAMLLQDYFAPPPQANSRRKTTKHGPRSEVEWAISRDGLNWSRSFRDIDATERVSVLAVQGPLVREGMLRFYERGRVISSIPEGRIFYVTGRGNCEFSTPVFQMPANGLSLNANCRYHPGEGEFGRGYLMAELRDGQNHILPGYEREKCLFENQDGQTLRLAWEGKTGSELQGTGIQVRFFFREAKLFSISAIEPE